MSSLLYDPHPTVCQLCGGEVEFIDNKEIYGVSYGAGKAYRCKACGAYVGTHGNSPEVALGVLADAEMRLLKVRAHDLFDAYWTDKPNRYMARTVAYGVLAELLGIHPSQCHFGYMDKARLYEAIDILQGKKKAG